jgi:hypothetical protein
MFVFKFGFNFVYLSLLYIKLLITGKNTYLFDEFINFDIVFLNNDPDCQYNNIISYKQFLKLLD